MLLQGLVTKSRAPLRQAETHAPRLGPKEEAQLRALPPSPTPPGAFPFPTGRGRPAAAAAEGPPHAQRAAALAPHPLLLPGRPASGRPPDRARRPRVCPCTSGAEPGPPAPARAAGSAPPQAPCAPGRAPRRSQRTPLPRRHPPARTGTPAGTERPRAAARASRGARGGGRGLTVRPVPSTITSYSSFMAGGGEDRGPGRAQARRGLAGPAAMRPPWSHGGSAQAGVGARRERGARAGAGTELERREAGRHLRREEKSGAGRGGKTGRAGKGGRRPGPPQPGRGLETALGGPSVTAFPPAHWLRPRRPTNLRPLPPLARGGRAVPPAVPVPRPACCHRGWGRRRRPGAGP